MSARKNGFWYLRLLSFSPLDGRQGKEVKLSSAFCHALDPDAVASGLLDVEMEGGEAASSSVLDVIGEYRRGFVRCCCLNDDRFF